MVLVLGLTSHSLIGSSFALDAKGLGEKAKTGTNSMKTDNSVAKSTDDSSKTKSNPPQAMTKVDKQKINREIRMAEEASKTANDKAKVDTFIKSTKAKPAKRAG